MRTEYGTFKVNKFIGMSILRNIFSLFRKNVLIKLFETTRTKPH